MDFFGWLLEQQLPTARASFSAEKIRLSERGCTVYRVRHFLADLAWVDLDLESIQAGGRYQGWGVS